MPLRREDLRELRPRHVDMSNLTRFGITKVDENISTRTPSEATATAHPFIHRFMILNIVYIRLRS